MNWPMVKLGDLADVSSGIGAPQDADAFGIEGIPFIRAGSLVKLLKGASEQSLELIHPEIAQMHKLKLFPSGTVVFAKSGMSATKGHIYQLEQPAFVVNHLATLIPHSREDGDYLEHVLRFRSPTCLIKDEAYPSIRLGEIKNMEVPAPSDLKIRKQITAILNQADGLRRKRGRAIDLLDQLGQAIFHEMYGDPFFGLSPSANATLGSVCKVSSGSTPRRSNSAYYSGKIPWVKTGEVVGGRINYTGEMITEAAMQDSSLKLYPPGTVLLAMYGQGKTRGQVGILDIEATTNQACAAITCSSSILPDFLFNQLKFGYESIRNMGRGGNQPNLNAQLVRNIPLVVPNLKNQEEFVKRIRAVETMSRSMKRGANRLSELFSGIQHRAFRREL